jgi:RNA polymerase sigma-70 factor (ECF subfamily)
LTCARRRSGSPGCSPGEPDEPEAQGLLALLLLLHARSAARVTAGGSLARLAEQDRGLWDRDLITEGQAIVRACVQCGHPGPYQIQAAINAVHSFASSFDSTNWRAILTLYDQLYTLTPTPVVALNRAVTLAEVRGPATPSWRFIGQHGSVVVRALAARMSVTAR